MKPEIVRFEPEHLLAFDWREFDREDCTRWTRELMRRHVSISYTGVVDGRVLGCAGVIFVEEGRAFAWLAASCELDRHKLWFHKTIKTYFRAIIRTCGLEYVFTWVRQDSARNRNWIEALGFEPQADSHIDDAGSVH